MRLRVQTGQVAYLFHDWEERLPARKLQTGKGDVCGCQTSVQWTCIISFWDRYLLGSDFSGPKPVSDLGLLHSFVRQVRISPCDGAIAIQF